ncbi:IclR family transcriptional regulator [Granulosicoccus antarcticus]|uniref:HTH-type transcriptional regulator TsaQ1/TsaQ2 n=1 Tax=Granulosicoccus antarcticus IMCC3135 TaxID=1192854 RepID=A0A2Z2NNY8_9GAMM|nr:IclR family transcriptional regulator [Granulosicoccus antarcticus]ASJ73136.1 HTH-type transcriptional regulator TsaQ1/TsaQ2 [Granulosicoccus antarcticus IMCC3135]
MSSSELPEKDRRFATTLARGLSVLRAFRPQDDGLGNAEIAERTGLPKSTVSRLTFTLQSLGYLNHLGRGDRYRPGPALLALGNLASGSMSFVDISGPIMQQLADETGTLSVLAVRDDNKMLLVKTWRPAGVPSLWLEVGQRVPFAGSSSGHALLASLSDERFQDVVKQVQIDDQLSSEHAQQIRHNATRQLLKTGFVVADATEYFTPNIHAASVPFYPQDLGEPVVFTSGAVPKDLTLERLNETVGPALRASVSELERIMGQSPVQVGTGA